VARSTNYEALHFTVFVRITTSLLGPHLSIQHVLSISECPYALFSLVVTSVPISTAYIFKWLRPFRLVRRRNHICSDFFYDTIKERKETCR
jgi:hypothetical protein